MFFFFLTCISLKNTEVHCWTVGDLVKLYQKMRHQPSTASALHHTQCSQHRLGHVSNMGTRFGMNISVHFHTLLCRRKICCLSELSSSAPSFIFCSSLSLWASSALSSVTWELLSSPCKSDINTDIRWMIICGELETQVLLLLLIVFHFKSFIKWRANNYESVHMFPH